MICWVDFVVVLDLYFWDVCLCSCPYSCLSCWEPVGGLYSKLVFVCISLSLFLCLCSS